MVKFCMMIVSQLLTEVEFADISQIWLDILKFKPNFICRWSFGVVVWEIASVGGAPYASVPGARLPRLLRAGYRMPKPNNCSPQL